jgi:hypothetical protein
MQRPTGVTALAMLYGLIGMVVIAEGGAISGISLGLIVDANHFPLVLGLLTIAGGICLFAFAYGAWGLKPWAWGLGIAIMIVAPILDLAVAGVNAIGTIVVAALIIFYLLRPHVREAFGRKLEHDEPDRLRSGPGPSADGGAAEDR